MKLSSTQLTSLRQKLPETLGQYVEADPDALTDFVMMFVERGNTRDELKNVFREELVVFCEDAGKTEQAVDDLLRLIDSVQQGESSSASQQQQQQPSSIDNTATTSGHKRSNDDDEDDDEDDDDRNFKRRNVSTSAAAEELPSPRTGEKRPNTADGDDRPKKQVRGGGEDRGLPSHLRQRLGPSSSEQRRRIPCRNFEERGFCVYGDSCKYDHGEEQITVNDYSKFQAIMGSSGAVGMPNPMMMQNTDPMYPPFSMGMGNMPFMTPAPIDSTSEDRQQQHHRQRQQPYGQQYRGGGGGRFGRPQQQDTPYTTRYDPNNNTIVVDKIPVEACNMESVTEAFKKFGTIVDISLQPEFQRAFLEYKTHAEARAAHQCPDVFFNNRFVKIFWKKMDRKHQQPSSAASQQSAKQHQQPKQQAEPDPELVKQRAAELAKINQEKQKQKREQLEKQIEANKRKQEIAKRELELAMLKAKVKAMEEAKKKESSP